jgi:hypothetical protein
MVAGSIPYEVIGFLHFPNLSNRIMYLVSTQSLPEMSNRNLPVVELRPTRKADNLTACCEPIV